MDIVDRNQGVWARSHKRRDGYDNGNDKKIIMRIRMRMRRG
jgi:hypothetical protein